MTRKRFQKLLMADGFSRDETAVYARIALCSGRSYSAQRRALSFQIALRRVCVSLKTANRILDQHVRKLLSADHHE